MMETLRGLRTRGLESARPSSSCWAWLLPEAAARVGLIDVQLGVVKHMKTMICAVRRIPYCTWECFEWRCACGWERERCGCWNKHIFSVLKFFIFYPYTILFTRVLCSCWVWVLVYPFYSRKKELYKTYEILKCSFIFMLLCLICFHIIFPQYYAKKNKVRHGFHKNSSKGSFILFITLIPSSPQLILMNCNLHFYESGSRM